MSGVEGLQEVGRFAAAHLADDDVIGPVPQGMAHEVADADGPVLYPRASNRTQFGRSVLSSKVSSMATIRFLRVAFQGSRITSDGRWCADAGRPTRFKPSSPSPTDAVRDGSAKLGHPVQNVTREHGLTPLPR